MPAPLAEEPPADLSLLVEAVALGEGFRFHLLISNSSRAVKRLIGLLRNRVEIPVVEIQPYRSLRDLEPLAFPALAGDVLDKLTSPEVTPGAVVVLDASRAYRRDEPAWRELFRRMNERRNGLARHLKAPLILCLPPRLEAAFAHEAPDFWSIRSSVVVLPAEPPGPDKKQASPLTNLETPIFQDHDRHRLVELAAEARRRSDASPTSWEDLNLLLTHLDRLRALAQGQGSLTEARVLAEEAVSRVRRFLEKEPQLKAAQSRLGWSLHGLADICLALGLPAEAFQITREVQKIAESQGNPVLLALAAAQYGASEMARGDSATAETPYRVALDLFEQLGDRGNVARIEHQLGVVAQDRGDLEEAQKWYEKALTISQELADLGGQAAAYHQLGRVAEGRGELAAAEELFRQALEVSDQAGNLYSRGGTLSHLGKLAQLQEDWPAAESWFRKALEDFQALDSRHLQAVVFFELGLIAEERDDLSQARSWYTRAEELFQEQNDPSGVALVRERLIGLER